MIEAMEKHAIQDGKKGSGGADSDEDPDTDPMFKQAVEVVIDAGQAPPACCSAAASWATPARPVSWTRWNKKASSDPTRRQAPRCAYQPPAVAGNADEPTGGMTLSGADAPALPKGELYEWVRYRLPSKKNWMKRCKKLPFEERLPPLRGKMSRSDKRGNQATPQGVA